LENCGLETGDCERVVVSRSHGLDGVERGKVACWLGFKFRVRGFRSIIRGMGKSPHWNVIVEILPR